MKTHHRLGEWLSWFHLTLTGSVESEFISTPTNPSFRVDEPTRFNFPTVRSSYLHRTHGLLRCS